MSDYMTEAEIDMYYCSHCDGDQRDTDHYGCRHCGKCGCQGEC